jgi:hypothetical protein
MGDERESSWLGLRVGEYHLGEPRFEREATRLGRAFDRPAELVVVEPPEQDVVGGDGGGQARVVGKVPVEVSADGDDGTDRMVDEAIDEHRPFLGVFAEREDLFELIDDERTRAEVAQRGHWMIPWSDQMGVDQSRHDAGADE